MEDSFGYIIGPVSVAINQLKDLPQLTTVEYYYDSSVIEDPIDFSEIGSIGFAKVTTLDCSNYFPSIHTKNIASLFPAVAKLTLVHLDLELAPNYGPLLAALKPDSLQSLELNCVGDASFEVEAGMYPIHQDLQRFKNLSFVRFAYKRVFDIGLVDAIVSLEALTCLYILRSVKISFELVHYLLSGLKNRNPVKELTIYLELEMDVGQIGLAYKDGAKPVLQNDILVPGIGWKKPIWSIFSREKADELRELAEEAGVSLIGSIPNAFKVEEAFTKELAWLDSSNYYMRNGRGKEGFKIENYE